jgi:hypothetical protein
MPWQTQAVDNHQAQRTRKLKHPRQLGEAVALLAQLGQLCRRCVERCIGG